MRAAVIAAGVCLSTIGPCLAQTSTAPMIRAQTRIPAQELGSALKQFAKLDHIQVLYLTNDVKDLRTSGASGYLTADETLTRLLRGTDLKYRYVDASAASIIHVAKRQSATGHTTSAPESLHRPKAASDRNAVPEDESSDPPTETIRKVKNASARTKGAALQQVVVTGTHISGNSAIASPLITLDKESILESGATTLSQVLMTLPADFGGGPQQDSLFSNQGLEAQNNVSAASSINLHGFGAGETLVLLNGRRLPPADRTSITDASLIPVSLVDRIDVMPDGASAIYGSDAVGGVVNIITRRHFHGVEVRSTYGDATRGGFDEFDGGVTGGLELSGGTLVFDYSYRGQSPLDASARSFSAAVPSRTDLFPRQTTNALYSGGQFDLGSQASLVFDLYGSQRKFNEAYNSFGQIYYWGRSVEFGTSTGIDVSLSDSWSTELYATLGKDQVTTSSMPAFSEHIGQWRRSVESITQGRLWTGKQGTARIAFGASYRNETYDAEYSNSALNTAPSRHVSAVFAELALPFVSPAQAIPMVRELALSLAGRYEHYSDFGHTADPMVGLVFSPLESLRMRGTFGRSFRAPTLFESRAFYEGDFLLSMPDPESPSGNTLVVLRGYGANPSLKPETADTWTWGLDFHPSWIRNGSLSATYYGVRINNRIDTALLGFDNLFPEEQYYPQLFDRNPDPAYVERLVATPWNGNAGFLNLYGPFQIPQVGAVIDDRFQNISTTESHGLDLSATFSAPIGPGDLRSTASVSKVFSFENRSGINVPPDSLLDTVGEPNSVRARASLSYALKAINLFAALNYVGDYQDTSGVTAIRIPSWTTLDLTADVSPAALRGLTIRFSAINATDRSPPYVNAATFRLPLGYDPANATPVGRFISLSLIEALQ